MPCIIEKNIKIVKLLTLFCFYFLIFHHNAKADAWTQKKQSLLLITTMNILSFNSTTSLGTFNPKQRVLQAQYILYGEYGLTDGITFGGKIIANDNFLSKNNSFFYKSTHRSFGLDGGQIFGRFKIYQNNFFVISVSQLIQSPSVYKDNEASYFSIKYWQYEPKLEIGFNIKKHTFSTISFGWHGNIKNWYDEMHLDITLGHYFSSDIMFLLQFQKYIFYIKQNNKHITSNYNLINIPIYDLITKKGFSKITLSFVFNVDKNIKFGLGLFTTIQTNKAKKQNLNIDLYGGFISLWFLFGQNSSTRD